MEEKYVRLILEGSIPYYLLRQTSIMFIGVVLLTSFTLVDIYFIARIDTQALTAVSFTTTPVLLAVGFLLGIGAGMTAIISNRIGSNQKQEINETIQSSLWLGGIIGLLFTLVGYLTHHLIFASLGAEATMVSKIGEYMFILYPGLTLLSLLIVILSIIRAYGNTSVPSMSAGLIVIINAILDPILIFGWGPIPAFGITGAALATLIGLIIGLGYAIVIFRKYVSLTVFTWNKEVVFQRWREILNIAAPIATTNALLPLGNSFIVRLLAEQSNKAVAAYGIGYRIDMFVILFFTALTATLAPFVGQNRGANKRGRIVKGIMYSMIGAFTVGLFIAGTLFLTKSFIGSFFTDEIAVLSYLNEYLQIVPWGYAFNGILMLSFAVLTVTYQPMKAAILAVLHLFGFYIPLAFWFEGLGDVTGIFWAYPISLLMASALALVFIKIFLFSKKIPKKINS